jgi:copper chaperone
MGHPIMKLSIPDMSCAHCEQAVRNAIEEVDPAAEVQIDLAAHSATVTTTSGEAAILAAVHEAGYDEARIA